jgi:hypothetical protein
VATRDAGQGEGADVERGVLPAGGIVFRRLRELPVGGALHRGQHGGGLDRALQVGGGGIWRVLGGRGAELGEVGAPDQRGDGRRGGGGGLAVVAVALLDVLHEEVELAETRPLLRVGGRFPGADRA